MNKIKLIIAVISLSTLSFAQKKNYRITINPYGGYEMNLLKAPASYSSGGITQSRNELWTNAPLVGISGKFNLWNPTKVHGFEIKSSYQRGLLPDTLPIRANEQLFGLAYQFNNHKKVKNEITFEFKNYVKTGEDQDNLLGVPLSYRRVELSDDLKLKLSKKWALNLSPFSIIKNYQLDNFERFLYWDNGLNQSLLFRYNLKRKVGFGLHGNVHQRNYYINKMVEGEEEPEEDEETDFEEDELVEDNTEYRIWRYYSGGFSTRIPLNDYWKVIVRADYTRRNDLLQNKFGYNQYELSSALSYKKKKWKGSLNGTFYRRDYYNFLINFNNEQVPLTFNVFKLSGALSHKFSDRFSLILRANGKARLSNVNSIDRRAFRSYLIGEATIGFVYLIK